MSTEERGTGRRSVRVKSRRPCDSYPPARSLLGVARSPFRRSDGHPRLDARVRPRAGAAVARSHLRLLRHHRHPRHDARAGARRHALLAVRIDRRGHHRRAAARAGHDLQVRGRGHQPRRRQVGHHRRQQAADREALFRAHGRFVETLGGRYITAEDVGTSPADMEYIKLETDHVAGLLGLVRAIRRR